MAGPALPADTWAYLSVCRDADGWVRLFADGVMVDKALRPTFHVCTPVHAKTMATQNAGHGGGFYGEFRATRAARYTSDAGHIVPAGPLPISVPGRGDPHWASVTMLNRIDTHGTVTGGSSTPHVPDSSRYSGSPGGVQWTWSTDAGVGVGSIRAPNSSQTANQAMHEGLDMKGLTPFTIECWINRAGLTLTDVRGIVGPYNITSNRRQVLLLTQNGRLQVYASLNGTAADLILQASVDLPVDGWAHAALTRDAAGVFRLHQNGVVVATSAALEGQPLFDAVAAGLPTCSWLTMNSAGSSQGFLVSEIRITRGVARYGAATFTPPTGIFPAYAYVEPAP